MSVLPVVLAGFCAFLTLFAPQPILPLLADVFHTSKVMISLTVTASTLGVAIAAPLIGQIADRVGRKRVIVLSAATLGVATLLTATSTNLAALLFWRFVQGVATPGVFSVTTAYVHDEWPTARAASAISAYVSGTIVGGFSGRVIAGFTAGTFWMALGVHRARMHQPFDRRVPLGAPARGAKACTLPKTPIRLIDGFAEHLRNNPLVAAYCVGSCVLFSHHGVVHVRHLSPRRAAVFTGPGTARIHLRRLPGGRGRDSARRAAHRQGTATRRCCCAPPPWARREPC